MLKGAMKPVESCNMMQFVSVCCSALQCDAVCCSVWQCVAVSCSVEKGDGPLAIMQITDVKFVHVRMCTATQCNTLHHTATTHYNTLQQHTATLCRAVSWCKDAQTTFVDPDTAYCIWSVISSFSNLNRWSSFLGLFRHVPLEKRQMKLRLKREIE